MSKATEQLLATALGTVTQRMRERASLEVRFGRRVGPNMFERHEDGVLISSLVVEGEYGRVVYRLIGLSWEESI